MPNNDELTLRFQINAAIESLNTEVDSEQLNQMILLFREAINLQLSDVNYVRFATGLINNATRLGIKSDFLVTISKILLKTTCNFAEANKEINEDFKLLMVDEMSAKLSTDNPYIGADGKDYADINDLKNTDKKFADDENPLKR